MVRERPRNGFPGLLILLVVVLALAIPVLLFVGGIRLADARETGATIRLIGAGISMGLWVLALRGFFVVNPNEAQVLQLFGDYAGTAKVPGLRWANPFFTRRKISLRVRNFESSHLKVNDADGNPIEIGAVVVWRVVETAEATFEVNDYENFLHVQTEAALRNAATSYPYDSHEEHITSLRGSTATVADHLKQEVQQRLQKAGLEVLEARISHLAYAPEIAAAMLQRQQAGAIIAARQRIVEGAVGMVEMALDLLSKREILEFDNERKAAMVSNLLVVLCGDRNTQPIVNAGTLHH
jgi:regulator of protease activity HflC (stomatin/prohibitin superfamily)